MDSELEPVWGKFRGAILGRFGMEQRFTTDMLSYSVVPISKSQRIVKDGALVQAVYQEFEAYIKRQDGRD